MASYEESICEAIDIIVNRAVATAGYDKTVQATIVSCVDATIGKYKCRYQDSTFYAYSGSSEVTYTNGAYVYVLIPGNDMSQEKTILGAVKKLGIDYVVSAEGEEAYEVNGINIIASTGSFDFSSYKEGTQFKLLYSKDNDPDDNLITIDTVAMNEYLKNSEVIICGGVFRTALPIEQQYRGNYGILFALDFLDNTENQVVTRYYTVDVDQMTGNPYKLITDTRQYGIFEIDAEHFIEVSSISVFCYDFPNSLPDEECVDDIFICDIEMSGANRLSDDDINNYTLTFVTPQGTYFSGTPTKGDTLTIEGQVRVKGKVIDNSSQSLPFYWGIEHVGVTSQSEYYCKYLGQGWKCLNDYNIIEQVSESDPMVVEWVPGSYKFTVKYEDVEGASEIRYKCAVIYDSTVITKTITIKNLSSSREIYIESDGGTQFYFDIGYPTLKCYVDKKDEGQDHYENHDYTYSWAVTNNVNTFSVMEETPELNDDYNALYAEYTALVEAIANEDKMAAANADTLAALEKSLAEYETITRVENNTIFHLNVNTITSFSTYQCTVFDEDDQYLGTASLVLRNTLDIEGTYSLVINNGCYAYKYNESGVSPASQAVDSPIEIIALTFTLYDNLGQAIDDDVARHCDIRWTVPTVNTLITIPSAYNEDAENPPDVDEEAGTATYKNMMSFSYGIADRYDISKTNNDIYLTVVYKDMSLSAKTELTFTKEGENGTNGTDYSIKIVPNPSTDISPVPTKWIATQNVNGSYSYNFTPRQSGKYLKVQLYHNEVKVYDSGDDTTNSYESDEGKSVKITWEMLQNKYTGSVKDDSSFTVSSDGVFSFSGYKTDHPANITKVTLVYDGITYYATYPIVTVLLSDSNYTIDWKENTGFQYAIYTSDGRTPQYDNTNPFEVIVKRYIDGYWEDVTQLSSDAYKMTYNWSLMGRIYGYDLNSSTKAYEWVVGSNLQNAKREEDESYNLYYHSVKPSDDYDGQCVTNAVQCTATDPNKNIVAQIHIPVHLYLNRYGLAALNGWDGNSIEIKEEEGFILSPQVGAGIKEDDNSFTGILIGAVKESGSYTSEVGLFGYAKGERSIFLDAYTGKAEFGVYGQGQIIIDPSGGTAQIYSGTYYTNPGTGLMIDLSPYNPSIQYGNGNFSVDSEGHITALGGGTIAGFNIDDYNIWSGSSGKRSESNVRLYCGDDPDESNGFSRTINGYTRPNLRFAIGTQFAVDKDGKMYAWEAQIDGGNIEVGAFIVDDTEIQLGDFRVSASDSYELYANDGSFSLTTSTTPNGNTATLYIGKSGDYTRIMGGNVTMTGTLHVGYIYFMYGTTESALTSVLSNFESRISKLESEATWDDGG